MWLSEIMQNSVVATNENNEMSMIPIGERPLTAYNEIEPSNGAYQSMYNVDEQNEDLATTGDRIQHLNNGNHSQVHVSCVMEIRTVICF